MMSSSDEDLPEPKDTHMALETAPTIGQLNPANPSGADRIQQGDDHIRLIKAALKNTFPNITGPVTLSQDELNAPFEMPVGAIVTWYGAAEAVPAGWAVCNGQTVNRSDGSGPIITPDLRDRVIIGAGGDFTVGQVAGSATSDVNTGIAGAHQHTVGGGEHTHTVNVQAANTPAPTISTTTTRVENEQSQATVLTAATLSGGGGSHSHDATVESATHAHTVSTEGAHQHSVSVSTLQPVLAFHFIIKV